jgi:hypothetical protein
MKNKSILLFGGNFVVKMFCGDLMQNVTDFSRIEQIVQDAREYTDMSLDKVQED